MGAKKEINTGNWMKDIYLTKMQKEKIKIVDVARGTGELPQTLSLWFNKPGGCVLIGSKIAKFLNLSMVEIIQVRQEEKRQEEKK